MEMRLSKFLKSDAKESKSFIKFKIKREENIYIVTLSSQENQRGLIHKRNIWLNIVISDNWGSFHNLLLFPEESIHHIINQTV